MAGRGGFFPQGPVPGSALLIFCSLGTHPQPFERAVDWVLAAIGDEPIIVQHGATASGPDSEAIRWAKYLGFDELVATMRDADAVVCHAGVGTVMTAIHVGAVPVVIPRLREGGEHVDDHQVQIAIELGHAGYVIPCMDRDSMAECLRRAMDSEQPPRDRFGELCGIAIAAAGGDPGRIGGDNGMLG